MKHPLGRLRWVSQRSNPRETCGNSQRPPQLQSTSPTVHIFDYNTDEDVPALVGCVLDDFAPEEKLNKENLDAPIKTESDSSVEEQITEAMVEQE